MIEWTADLELKIFSLIAGSSKSLKRICEENPDLPSASTIWQRIVDNKEFSDEYARAKEWQADYMADEIMSISDALADLEDAQLTHEKISAAKLRVDSRKWAASKLKPKKYGDKIDHTTDNESFNKRVDLSGVPMETLLELAKHLNDTK